MKAPFLVAETKCDTCPFREGTKYAFLRPMLTQSALTEASRICHSTGRNGLNQTRKRSELCRGARDEQLQVFHRLGLLTAPTDEAWAARWKTLQENRRGERNTNA